MADTKYLPDEAFDSLASAVDEAETVFLSRDLDGGPRALTPMSRRGKQILAAALRLAAQAVRDGRLVEVP